ncbi:hypothetical protein FEK34_16575 [Nocardia cyriacigeorgica]|uniref:Uncharacterized protein n=1 Tax=Nocardia cyriacigeorgica TaxID=135487 RepID=A0A5R8NML7_9NOCA|nr:hypothetical protein FEK34_16575 [Nocardia cyriacigeorgica]
MAELAERHGFRLAYTVELVAGRMISHPAMAQHIAEHDAAAVIVPSFEHAEAVRRTITGAAALITPMRIYPRGHRWPASETGGRL